MYKYVDPHRNLNQILIYILFNCVAPIRCCVHKGALTHAHTQKLLKIETRTQVDMSEIETRTQVDMSKIETRTQVDMSEIETRTQVDMSKIETRTQVDMSANKLTCLPTS